MRIDREDLLTIHWALGLAQDARLKDIDRTSVKPSDGDQRQAIQAAKDVRRLENLIEKLTKG